MNKYSMSFILLALISPSVFAHTGTHNIEGFVSGFIHPFLGLDHLSVMFGLGLLVSRFKPVHSLLSISLFLSFMLMGASLALFDISLSGIETAILFSVFITALLLIQTRTLSFSLILSLIASFALIHGFAHGAEMPLANNPLHYMLGFSCATVLLQTIGLIAGRYFTPRLVKYYGYFSTVLACYLLITN